MPQLNNRWCVTQPNSYASNSAQINTACNVATTTWNTLTVGITAGTFTFNSNCKSFIAIPSVTPSAPIFIRYYTPASGSTAWALATATTTTCDRILNEAYPAMQEWRPEQIESFSYITTVTQTLYIAQLP